MEQSLNVKKRKVQNIEKESEGPVNKKTKTKVTQNVKESRGKIKSKEKSEVPNKKTKTLTLEQESHNNATLKSKQNNDPRNTVIDCDEAEMLSHIEKIPLKLASNFISLLSAGCTLPFIARYRKEAVDFLMPDRLQELFESYQNVTQLKKKMKSVIETLKKSKKLTQDIEKSIFNARSLSEIDLLYAPLKSHSLSLAERARNLGLESYAIRMLNGEYIDLKSLCTGDEELCSESKVDTHITHILADIIYKDTRVLEQMRKLKEETRFTIQSSRSKNSTKEKENSNKKIDSKSDPETYKLYFEWSCPCHFVKPHQTLAINRGEDEKILSIKVIIPDWFYNKLERYCLTLWKSKHWVCKGLSDAYNRLIKSWLSRQVRSDLTAAAEKEAVKTFTTNLEKYLLTEPIKNRTIAGLDPGFKAGCKVGIINPNGDKVEACTIYPNLRQSSHLDPAVKQLKDLLTKHRVDLIGLGNGTACRETESWLKTHHIVGNIPIVIVPEQGASIYSISKEAQKEHPNMDPNLISALSIARRVMDPLGELIKVDPKNLGVGLYQHDVPPKMLETGLDCTVEKVVSLVGVDINTASQAMLRRIAGLNDGRAKKILAYRQDRGGFASRAEILKVTGIGKITYQQCAGFLRVLGGTEPLDSTIIHPESYNIAKSIAKKIDVNIKDLNKPHFPQLVESKLSGYDINKMSKDLDADVSTLELIIGALKQKTNEGNIISFCRPVYSISVQGVDQLQEGMTLTGIVRNVVPFGCFVDCGIGENGLIHRSKLSGCQTPKLGDRVSVTVIPSTKPKKIQLKLEKILD
ncbi:S1 RNA-binding domain-containing protein 1 [Achroia grisella]|uniref:S1 RNA-binding domain-containing protein 1 n=1 Tax=Achroia grisella TaxID=688607 RepID=UPI0027D35027|nr:S1 RNA-binding domain-containing protein 1 [Achroia grisella]